MHQHNMLGTTYDRRTASSLIGFILPPRRFTMLSEGCGESWRTYTGDMSFIKERLYIGSRVDAIDLANSQLPEDKLRILTVDFEPLGIEDGDGILTKHVQCLDEPEADLLSFFDECSEFITRGLESKENVLVHW